MKKGPLTSKEFNWYLKNCCTLETSPRCSVCDTQNDDIHTDEQEGSLFCNKCLFESLNEDEDIIKEIREEMKEQLK